MMKNFYYAVQDENGTPHTLTLHGGENLAAIIRTLHLVIVHPCKTFAEAVKIAEAWRKEKCCS